MIAVWSFLRGTETLGGDDEQATAVRRAKAAFPKWGPVTIARVVNKAMPTKKPLTPKQVRGILAKPLS